jgi:hypothetical protein
MPFQREENECVEASPEGGRLVAQCASAGTNAKTSTPMNPAKGGALGRAGQSIRRPFPRARALGCRPRAGGVASLGLHAAFTPGRKRGGQPDLLRAAYTCA